MFFFLERTLLAPPTYSNSKQTVAMATSIGHGASELVSENVMTREKFTFFFGRDTVFSQWHRTAFTVDGVQYGCAEQYMMHQKAR